MGSGPIRIRDAASLLIDLSQIQPWLSRIRSELYRFLLKESSFCGVAHFAPGGGPAGCDVVVERAPAGTTFLSASGALRDRFIERLRRGIGTPGLQGIVANEHERRSWIRL